MLPRKPLLFNGPVFREGYTAKRVTPDASKTTSGLPRPDLTVYFDLDYSEGIPQKVDSSQRKLLRNAAADWLRYDIRQVKLFGYADSDEADSPEDSRGVHVAGDRAIRVGRELICFGFDEKIFAFYPQGFTGPTESIGKTPASALDRRVEIFIDRRPLAQTGIELEVAAGKKALDSSVNHATVYFTFGSGLLMDSATEVLSAVSKKLLTRADGGSLEWKLKPEFSKVIVIGFSDAAETPPYEVSLARAKAVSGWLKCQGVPEQQISTFGVGKSFQHQPTAAGVREPLNRVVEVRVVPAKN